MTELLAAIHRLLSNRRDDDYEYLRQSVSQERLLQRAIERTNRQMNDAYVNIIQEPTDDTYAKDQDNS